MNGDKVKTGIQFATITYRDYELLVTYEVVERQLLIHTLFGHTNDIDAEYIIQQVDLVVRRNEDKILIDITGLIEDEHILSQLQK